MFGLLWFIVVIWPFLVIMEGYSMFKDLMTRKNWWGKLPYAILAALIILLLILLAKGYRY